MPQLDSISHIQQTPGRTKPRAAFRYDIEGLRGVTLLAILGFHAEVPGVGGGFIGPDIFFVISGFVITGGLWRELDSTGTVGLLRFYGGRARRLLPVAALVGVVTLVSSAALLSSLELRRVVFDGIACALYVGNYRFALDGVDYFASDRPPSPFQHYWTLGVEEQFYVMWPLALAATAWFAARASRSAGTHAARTPSSKAPYLALLTLVAVVSFALSWRMTYTMPSMAYFSLPTRAWDLAVGCLLALTVGYWRRLPASAAGLMGWTGLALIVLACNQFRPTTPYPGVAALVPLVGSVLILGAGCATPLGGCGRLLAWAPMRAVGRLSYSWYLWHWPALIFVPVLLDRPVNLADRLAAVALSGGMAMLTLHFLENPLRYANALRRSPTRSLAVGALATGLAVCIGVAVLVVVPTPAGRSRAGKELSFTAEPRFRGGTAEQYERVIARLLAEAQDAVGASADSPDVPSNLHPALAEAPGEVDRIYFGGCLRNFLETGQPECAMADMDSPDTVALVGDSNAAMWTPGFQDVAMQRHLRLELLAKGLCPVQDLPTLLQHRPYTECDQWRAEILSRLQAEKPKLIVLSMLRRYGSAELPEDFTSFDSSWNGGMTRLVRQLHETGARVLVLGPIPDPQTKAPDCLAIHIDDAAACSASRPHAVNDSGITSEAAAVIAGGGQYADVTDLFCTADRCPVIVGNTLVYFDRMHATLEYAQLLSPVLGAFVDRALADS